MGKQFETCFKNFSRQANVTDAHSVLTPENATSLAAVVQRHPITPVSRLAAQSGITPYNMWRILRKTLYIFPRTIQCRRTIPVLTERQREDLGNVMLDMIDGSGFDVSQIWFIEEASFHLDVVVNGLNGDFEVPETLKHDHKLPFGLHSPAERSLAYTKR